ncbi:type II toxin-antitoxin system RelE/ParE family toxin [Chenggangzhangella methanolivorans]|uniref:Type II toxin-antitoxin system RelE/ParE family toxin n=1 Tax=Chenggangzhangella methanolivorans TaxID=1437009 RepID=A0A9E6R8D6_9HYPH|nr:type II toxin-antitoxin system RelE/ParE family toxin [Chenggangzhangella methanolivorans]QZN99709.1 type II toxin-antitoxin system RelE/ParE family toxin [Chenggangzhangella methanolivorans]
MTDWTLAPQAERDLRDLYVYGAEAFGRTAALTYVDQLLACCATLAEQPRMGRAADAARRGARRFEHGRHVIYYEERPPGVLILAIIHERSIRGTGP